MDRQELEKQIEDLGAEIETDKAELDDIQAKLGRDKSLDTNTAGNKNNGENTSINAESGGNTELSDEQKAELEAKEKELLTTIVSKQMKMAALQKQLNDVISNEAMANVNKEV